MTLLQNWASPLTQLAQVFPWESRSLVTAGCLCAGSEHNTVEGCMVVLTVKDSKSVACAGEADLNSLNMQITDVPIPGNVGIDSLSEDPAKT